MLMSFIIQGKQEYKNNRIHALQFVDGSVILQTRYVASFPSLYCQLQLQTEEQRMGQLA